MLNCLLFHRLVARPEEHGDVAVPVFEELLRRVARSGRPTTTLREAPPDGSGPAIALTFDDGSISDYEAAFPLLASLGFKATFFIVTDFVGRPGHINWDQLGALAAAGMEIGSHTKSHRYLTTLEDDAVLEELSGSKDELERRLGSKVVSVSFPGGFHDGRTLDLSRRAGYRFTATSRPGLNDLPLATDRGVSRNALHRYVRVQDLDGWIDPSGVRLGVAAVGYELRSAVKSLLPAETYRGLRDRLLRLAPR